MHVWCMLVVRLNDEMKTSMHRMIVRYALLTFKFFKWYQNLAYNVDLMTYVVLCLCKCYLTNNGAKDGIIGALRLVSRFKGPSLTPQHHLVDITLPHFLFIHTCNLLSKLLAHMQGELMLPIRVHETCPKSFTHGKNAWASNMDSNEFQFISL